MGSQTTLDYLVSINEHDRLTYILDNFDSLINSHFIEFLKGQIEFSVKELDGAGHFNKVSDREDTGILNAMKAEMKDQAKNSRTVWNSLLKVSSALLDKEQFGEVSSINKAIDLSLSGKHQDMACRICNIPAEGESLCDDCS